MELLTSENKSFPLDIRSTAHFSAPKKNWESFVPRPVPIVPGTKFSKRIIYLGGSYTYGEGLSDRETLPAQLLPLLPDYQPTNLGLAGWGPNNILKALRKGNFEMKKTGTGIVVYFFISDHFFRVSPSLLHWPRNVGRHPYFFTGPKGEILGGDSFHEAQPVRQFLSKLLGQSAFLKHFAIDFPSNYSKQDYKFFASMIAEIKLHALQQFSAQEFYVISLRAKHKKIWSGIKEQLLAQDINVLDYGWFFPIGQNGETFELANQHPDGLYSRILAQYGLYFRILAQLIAPQLGSQTLIAAE